MDEVYRRLYANHERVREAALANPECWIRVKVYASSYVAHNTARNITLGRGKYGPIGSFEATTGRCGYGTAVYVRVKSTRSTT